MHKRSPLLRPVSRIAVLVVALTLLLPVLGSGLSGEPSPGDQLRRLRDCFPNVLLGQEFIWVAHKLPEEWSDDLRWRRGPRAKGEQKRWAVVLLAFFRPDPGAAGQGGGSNFPPHPDLIHDMQEFTARTPSCGDLNLFQEVYDDELCAWAVWEDSPRFLAVSEWFEESGWSEPTLVNQAGLSDEEALARVRALVLGD